MREVWVLVRAAWLTRASYRLQTALSLAGIVASAIPLFFITNALQPVMAESIESQGPRYFGFVLVGTVGAYFVNTAVQTLPNAIATGIGRGTLEALLGTPAPLPAILAGLIGGDVLFLGLRAVLLLAAGWALGGGIHLGQLIPGAGILLLMLLAYLPVGLFGAALVLVFRTAGPLPQAVAYLSILLGGVYYPTHIIPAWIQDLSYAIPLTYGLRALRRVVLNGAGLDEVAADIGILAGFAVALLALGSLAFLAAFRYARRTGSLAQY